jgi:hypothetical protein
MRDGSGPGAPARGRSQRRRPSADSSNRSLRTQTDRCRGRRTSCGRPLVPQAQRAPQSRRSKPPYPFPGLLPGLAAGRIAEAAVASVTEGRSNGGLTSGTSQVGRRGVLTYPQGKPLKPSYAAHRLAGPPKCSSARKTRCSPRCHNGSPALRGGPAHTSEPEESWARRARLDHYHDGLLRPRGPCGDGHGRQEGSWALATEVPCWVCACGRAVCAAVCCGCACVPD